MGRGSYIDAWVALKKWIDEQPIMVKEARQLVANMAEVEDAIYRLEGLEK